MYAPTSVQTVADTGAKSVRTLDKGMNVDMTEKQARYYMEVYANMNIALAAKRLYVSRPVISRTISELEREFGAKLFIRSNTGLKPTEVGTMLYRHIDNITESYNALMSNIRNHGISDESRLLRFGVTPTNAFRVYNDLLRDFLKTYSDINISIIEKPAGEATELLLSGSADVVFTPQVITGSYLETLDGFQANLSLGISAANPLSSREVISIFDIFSVTFGSLCAPMPVEQLLIDGFSSYGKKPNITIRSTSLDLLMKMVQDGRIAVVLPDYMMNSFEGVAVIPVDFVHISTHKLVWSKLVVHNSAFEDLIAYAKKVFTKK